MAVAAGVLFTMERHGDTEGVHAYSATTGSTLWRERHNTEFKRILGNDGSQTTPTWDRGRVFALGVTGDLRSLDAATGLTIWQHDIVKENGATLPEWGMAASPLVIDGMVVVLPGGPRGRSVVAYDRDSGRRLWSALDDRPAYTAPMLVTLDDVRQLLVVSATRALGLRPQDGKVLWSYPWQTTELGLNITQPVVVGATGIVLATGYAHGAVMLDVRRVDGVFQVRQVWSTRDLDSKFNAPVVDGQYLYGFDEQDLVCLDSRTGKARWRERWTFGFGQIILAGSTLIVVSEDGQVALVSASPDRFQRIAGFQPLNERTYNVPALSRRVLYVRSRHEMKAFELPGTAGKGKS